MELPQANLAVVDDLTLIYVPCCPCITKAKRPSNCQIRICQNKKLQLKDSVEKGR